LDWFAVPEHNIVRREMLYGTASSQRALASRLFIPKIASERHDVAFEVFA
jgi:hypothetical protein